MARGTRLDLLARVGALVSLVCLTFVLALLGIVFARSGAGIWWVMGFVGLPLWLAFALHERSRRSTS